GDVAVGSRARTTGSSANVGRAGRAVRVNDWTVTTGECLEVMAALPVLPRIEAIVTDPPYGLAFMGKAWDHGVPGRPFWAAALHVCSPGTHLLAFGGTRTYHRLACALEDSGFEIRDCLMWLYGSGFPKSLNIGDGRGTALKPAWEPIILARKPLVGTVAANAAAHGTGALRIDDCRIGTDGGHAGAGAGARVYSDGLNGPRGVPVSGMGRWPANVVLDEAAAAQLDAHSGHLHAAANKRSSPRRAYEATSYAPGTTGDRLDALVDHDGGGASRFFYTAKASRSERNDGIHGLPA